MKAACEVALWPERQVGQFSEHGSRMRAPKPAHMGLCSGCGALEAHNKNQNVCYQCAQFFDMQKRGRRGRVGLPSSELSLTRAQFDRLMRTKVCADTGHVFTFGEMNSLKRRSVDRIDNSKGYHMENLLVVTMGGKPGALHNGHGRVGCVQTLDCGGVRTTHVAHTALLGEGGVRGFREAHTL